MAAFAEAVRSITSGVGRFPRAIPAKVHGKRSPADPLTTRSLASLVAGEIIPRLMLAHDGIGAPVGPMAVAPAPPSIELDAFVPMTLEGDARALLGHVERLLAQGVTADTLMIDLFAPAARMLGRWWEEDRCDFVEVTMGLWRLQQVVREVSQRVAPPAHGLGGRARRALFAAFPGDQHDFGAVMVGEMFRRHDWDAETLIGCTMAELLAETGGAHYDVIGLTLSCDCHSARLPSAILALRSVSRNPRVRIIVGGRVLNEDPALAGRAGADGTARDARDALALADDLVDAVAHAVAACG